MSTVQKESRTSRRKHQSTHHNVVKTLELFPPSQRALPFFVVRRKQTGRVVDDQQ